MRQQLENILELDFEDRALLYTDEIAMSLIAERIDEISYCSDHDKCTALDSKIETYEHTAARKYISIYIMENPRKRIAMPAYAVRMAIRHVLICALLREHAGAIYGNPECEKTAKNLFGETRYDHMESIVSSVRKELTEDELFQKILRLKEDARFRNSEEYF